MRFTAPRDPLLKAVSACTEAVPRKEVRAASGLLRLSCAGETLSVEGYDGEVGLRRDVPLGEDGGLFPREDGDFFAPGKRLAECLRFASEAPEFSQGGGRLLISGPPDYEFPQPGDDAVASWAFAAGPAEDGPPALVLDSAALERALALCVCACCEPKAGGPLTGVLLAEAPGARVGLYATDRGQMAACTLPPDDGSAWPAPSVLSARFVALLRSCLKECPGQVRLRVDGNSARASGEGFLLYGLLLEGAFPPCAAVLKAPLGPPLSLQSPHLLAACRSCAAVMDAADVACDVTFSPSGLSLRYDGAFKARAFCPAAGEGVHEFTQPADVRMLAGYLATAARTSPVMSLEASRKALRLSFAEGGLQAAFQMAYIKV